MCIMGEPIVACGLETVMDRKLEGRRILVTGGASGMGKEIAALFAAHGASLALLDRYAFSSQVGLSYQCDVSDRSRVAQVVDEAVAALGGIDGIVNSAGVLDIKPFPELSPESWDRMFAVNVTGPFNVVHAALPFLQAAERAAIVNIGSVSGLMPMAGTSGYSASKAALHMFTKGLAFDLGPSIRANTIAPGTIRTEMTRYLWENPEHLARAGDRVALKRVGDALDVARAALFLMSDESGFTTGTELPVDGGFAWR
jgi:NAD(P)-dependent dehydrogenase (short-subunit alcohol dehydrogenase family)